VTTIPVGGVNLHPVFANVGVYTRVGSTVGLGVGVGGAGVGVRVAVGVTVKVDVAA
jgi:hypothetical protein